MIKKITVLIFFIFLFGINASAQESDSYDFYRKQYELSGAEELRDALPYDTQKYLEQNGIDPTQESWTAALTAENTFSHIWHFIKSGAKAPISAGGGILSIILLSAAISSFNSGSGSSSAALTVSVLSTAAVIAAPALSVISAATSAMKGCSVFMTAFIPVFAVITASCGKPAVSASMSALLLGASQAVSYIANFIVIPLVGGYMAVSLTSAVSPLTDSSGIAEGIKKLAFWIMSLAATVFIGILSIQTAVNAAADTLSLKTAKFIIGSSVPFTGNILSEALSTVTASMGMLKSSVGAYGVIACCAIFLPLLAELLLWRIILNLTAAAAELFSLPAISAILRCADTVMSVISGIILLTCAVFVISLTVVISAGNRQ